MDHPNEVLDATYAEDVSTIGGRAPAIGFSQVTNVFIVHSHEVTELSETFYLNAGPGGFVFESYPSKCQIHRVHFLRIDDDIIVNQLLDVHYVFCG